MTILRSLCSVALVVLFFSVTAPVIQSGEFRNRRSVTRDDVVEQRTELFAPQVTTAVSSDGHTIAIARSSGGFEKRHGRVELWDLTSGALQRVITGFDGEILEAQRRLWDTVRIAAEPGGAAAFAGLLSGKYKPAPGERVGVIVCGGNTEKLPQKGT